MYVPPEPIDQIKLHGFNLLSNWESRDSLEELIKNDYTLEMYRTYEIKRFCRYYLNGSCDFMARRIIKKIEALEMKEQKEGTEIATSSSSSSSVKPSAVVATSSVNKPSTSALPTVTVNKPVVEKTPISKDIPLKSSANQPSVSSKSSQPIVPPTTGIAMSSGVVATSSANKPFTSALPTVTINKPSVVEKKPTSKDIPIPPKPSVNQPSVSSAMMSSKPTVPSHRPLPEVVISSKRTLPTKFVPKKKEAVSVVNQKPSHTVQNPEGSRKPSIDNKLDAEKRLQKFLENKKIAEEKKKEGAIEVSKVMNSLEEARLKRKQEALRAKELGFWQEEPKAKKARHNKYEL